MERKKMHLSTFFYIANWFLASCAFPKPHRQHNSIYLHWLILFQRKDLIFSKINKSIISFISHIANSQISLWYWKILISAVGSTNGIFVVRSVDNSSTLFSNKVSTLVNESCVSTWFQKPATGRLVLPVVLWSNPLIRLNAATIKMNLCSLSYQSKA